MLYTKKNQCIFLLFCAFFLLALACNSDSNNQQIETSNDAMSTNNSTTIEQKQQKVLEEHLTHEKIVEKQKEKSSLKKKKCDEILQKYDADIKKYLESGNDNDLLEIAEWANDPIFENCKQQAAYKIQFDKLDELLMD